MSQICLLFLQYELHSMLYIFFFLLYDYFYNTKGKVSETKINVFFIEKKLNNLHDFILNFCKNKEIHMLWNFQIEIKFFYTKRKAVLCQEIKTLLYTVQTVWH